MKGHPASLHPRARLDVEVVENLHVIGQKTDGREDHVAVATGATLLDRRQQLRPEPFDRLPPRPVLIPWL